MARRQYGNNNHIEAMKQQDRVLRVFTLRGCNVVADRQMRPFLIATGPNAIRWRTASAEDRRQSMLALLSPLATVDAGVSLFTFGSWQRSKNLTCKLAFEVDEFLSVIQRHNSNLAQRFDNLFQNEDGARAIYRSHDSLAQMFHRETQKFAAPTLPGRLVIDGAEDVEYRCRIEVTGLPNAINAAWVGHVYNAMTEISRAVPRLDEDDGGCVLFSLSDVTTVHIAISKERLFEWSLRSLPSATDALADVHERIKKDVDRNYLDTTPFFA